MIKKQAELHTPPITRALAPGAILVTRHSSLVTL
jgi:hypothetical protein